MKNESGGDGASKVTKGLGELNPITSKSGHNMLFVFYNGSLTDKQEVLLKAILACFGITNPDFVREDSEDGHEIELTGPLTLESIKQQLMTQYSIGSGRKKERFWSKKREMNPAAVEELRRIQDPPKPNKRQYPVAVL